MNTLLIEESPMMVLPSLAVTIGLNEAIILQQLHFLLLNSKSGKMVSGSRHIYNTYQEWEQHFPFFSVSTIKRTFRNLERQQLVLSVQPDRYRCNHRKYYRVNYRQVENLAHQSTKTFDRVKAPSTRSNRTGQIEPIAAGQFGLSNIQRREKTKNDPPTPGPSSGGYSTSPGTKLDGSVVGQSEPGTPRLAAHGSDHGDSGSSVQGRRAAGSWAAGATVHPAGPVFLALTDLTSFPVEGRQPLARAFIKACESGVVSLAQLRLIQAVQHRVNIPGQPLEFVRSFATVARDAYEAAEQRIQEISGTDLLTSSDPAGYLKAMAAVEAQMCSFTPEDLFGSGMVLPFARWILLAVCIQRHLAVEKWIEQLKAHILEEFAVDPGAVVFLTQFGLCLASFGITEAEIQETRTMLQVSREQERDNLIRLLTYPP